jgi:thioredoxin 1
MIAPVIEQLAGELSGRVVVGKLDVDANPQTAARFGVQSIPTLLVVKDGREVGRLVGAQPKASILHYLNQFI